MKKLGAVAAVVGLSLLALGLCSCGSSSGKEGGTLKGTYASFPDYLDPALSYTQEGLTAMYDTYIPLLTYARAEGEEGGKVVPGLAKSMPKISNGGKTYTLTLRKGLRYSNGSSVKASDFKHAIERVLALNSQASASYLSIVGAEKFQKTKKGGISGIKTDDKTGEITIELTAPRGTFTNELGLLYGAPVPGNTPIKNMTASPPPATGPYVISKVEPGRSWSYERNPQWAKNNEKLVSEVPGGHVDKIEIKVVSNPSTQVNEVERGSSDWMQTTVPPDLYNKVKEKYEGTQFRVEPTISNYFFWMNTTKPPFNDVKVRKAVNYALNGEALERIYAGSLKAIQQILPPGMPGYKQLKLYPHDMRQGEEADRRSQPQRPQRDRLGRRRTAEQRSRPVLRRRARQTRLQREAEGSERGRLFHPDHQPVDARSRHRLARLVRGIPPSEQLLRTAALRRKHPPGRQHQPLPDRRTEAEREDPQAQRRTARCQAGSRIRAARPRIHGAGPLGALRDAHRLDLRLQRDRPRKRDLQPDLRPGRWPASSSSSRRPPHNRAVANESPHPPAPAGRGPWRLAWGRLRRNRVALAFLGLFALIVLFVLAAPLWAENVAHTGPNTTHTLEKVSVGGQKARRGRARRGYPSGRSGSAPAAASSSAPTAASAATRWSA